MSEEAVAEKLDVVEKRLEEALSEVDSLKNEASATRQQVDEGKKFLTENIPIAQSSINDIRAHRESSVAAADEVLLTV